MNLDNIFKTNMIVKVRYENNGKLIARKMLVNNSIKLDEFHEKVFYLSKKKKIILNYFFNNISFKKKIYYRYDSVLM